jgi:DNA repair exonuclease SbcCD ATPase subunit
MDEMMAELKKRQERICEIEKRASKAEKRLSNLEEESSDAAKLRAENETLQVCASVCRACLRTHVCM